MKGDFTRFTFRKDKHYSAVRMQQGRVQMDADWNEHVDIQAHLNRTGTADVIGKSGVPYEGGGFQIGVRNPDASGSGDALTISPGRIYIDGILCENESSVTFDKQPYYPNPEYSLCFFGSPPVSPPLAGDFLAYLDVWERHITALDDKEIREVALGGPDTATRSQIIWQVKFAEADGSPPLQCSDDTDWRPDKDKEGTMAAKIDPGENDTKPCSIPEAGGYRRLENQLYRVEIHDKNNDGKWTFKWSRENGSIVAKLIGSEPAASGTSGKLEVYHPRTDELSRFATGDWVEVFDESMILAEKPGLFVRIGEINGDELEIAETYGNAKLPESGVVRKWEGGKPRAIDEFKWQDIESGIKVQFKNGMYNTGDYWTIPARTISHSIEWPKDETSEEPLDKTPEGIMHHYYPLALVHCDGFNWSVLSDCRNVFPPLTSMLRFFYLGGDGQEVTPDLSNPGTLVPLNQPLRVGVSNGSIPVENASVLFTVIFGSGQLQKLTSPMTLAGFISVKTDNNGVADCNWWIDPMTPHQVVEAKLLDPIHGVEHQTIRFHASPSIASEVAYKVPDCKDDAEPTVRSFFQSTLGNWPDFDLDGKSTVKDILDTLLCKLEASVIPFNVQKCNNDPSVRSQLDIAVGKRAISEVLDKLLCTLNATHLPVDKKDPALCPELKNDADVKTVQDALNALCKMDQGRSCSVTVSPNDRLEEVLKRLLEEGRTDICICLLPGKHNLNTLDLGLGNGEDRINVRISGCGPNTRIITKNVLNFSNLASIELRDIGIESMKKLQSLLVFNGCENVSLTSCHLSCLIDGGSLLRIGGSEYVLIENNIIEAYDPKVPDVFSKVFDKIATLETLFPITNRNVFIKTARSVGKTLSEAIIAERKKIGKKLSETISELMDLLSEPENTVYKRFIAVLQKNKVIPRELMSALIEIRDITTSKNSASAVAILDANEQTIFDNNSIIGNVNLYGIQGNVTLTTKELKDLRSSMKNSQITVSSSSGILQFRNNKLNRMLLGTDFIKDVKELIEAQKGEIREIFKISYFSENTFYGGENQFAIQHLNLISNGFYPRDKSNAGWAVAQNSIFVGNSAEDIILLSDISTLSEMTANLKINIQ